MDTCIPSDLQHKNNPSLIKLQVVFHYFRLDVSENSTPLYNFYHCFGILICKVSTPKN